MNTTMKNEAAPSLRKVYLDILKVIATFGVILLHVSVTDFDVPIKSHDWYVSVVGDCVVRWSVPIFIMISGVLFLNPQKDVSKESILKKYIPRLLKAYFFWYLTYIVIDTIDASLTANTLAFHKKPLLPHFHLWFLPMLMGVYLLVPFLRLIASNNSLLKYALIIWISYLTISFVLIYQIPLFNQNFALNFIVGYSGYFLLGYYLSITSPSRRQRRIIYILGILGVSTTVAGVISISLYRGESDQRFLQNLTPHVVLAAMALFVFIKQITPFLNKGLISFTDYVRKDLFGVYLTHGIWLIVINTDFFRNLLDKTISVPIITIIVFVMSLYTTKFLRTISGIKRFVE